MALRQRWRCSGTKNVMEVLWQQECVVAGGFCPTSMMLYSLLSVLVSSQNTSLHQGLRRIQTCPEYELSGNPSLVEIYHCRGQLSMSKLYCRGHIRCTSTCRGQNKVKSRTGSTSIKVLAAVFYYSAWYFIQNHQWVEMVRSVSPVCMAVCSGESSRREVTFCVALHPPNRTRGLRLYSRRQWSPLLLVVFSV